MIRPVGGNLGFVCVIFKKNIFIYYLVVLFIPLSHFFFFFFFNASSLSAWTPAPRVCTKLCYFINYVELSHFHPAHWGPGVPCGSEESENRCSLFWDREEESENTVNTSQSAVFFWHSVDWIWRKKNNICLHDWEESVALEGRRCLITNRMINKAEVVIKKSVICHINEHWTLLSLFICVEMFQIQTGLLCFHSLAVQNQLRQVPEPRQGSALLLRIRHAGTEHAYKYTYLLMLKGIKRDPRTGGKK